MFMIYLKWKENQHALGTYTNNNYKIVIKSKGATEFIFIITESLSLKIISLFISIKKWQKLFAKKKWNSRDQEKNFSCSFKL